MSAVVSDRHTMVLIDMNKLNQEDGTDVGKLAPLRAAISACCMRGGRRDYETANKRLDSSSAHV